MLKKGFKNVLLLSTVQALLLCSVTMTGFVSSIIGYDLAPSRALSTLPLSLLILGNALNILPSVFLIKTIGRKNGFRVGICLAILGLSLGYLGLSRSSFVIYSLAHLLLGCSISFIQQYRFAAAESVEAEEVPKAVSWILMGSIFAGLVGPQIAVWGKGVIPSIAYGGAYAVLMLFCVAAFFLLTFLQLPNKVSVSDQSEQRSLRQLLRDPKILIAIGAGTLSYAVMTFIMTATPISMHKLSGFSLSQTKWVIQSHILAMFLPSLFTGSLIKRFGHLRVVWAGVLLFFVCVAIGQIDQSHAMYLVELILLGIGWNFLFIAGTSLLTTAYSASEQFKVQGLNDVSVFGTQFVASFFAGFLVLTYSWQALNIFCLIVLFCFSTAFLILVKKILT